MENLTKNEEQVFLKEQEFFSAKVHRRSFLQYAGAGAAGIALIAAGCKKTSANMSAAAMQGFCANGMNFLIYIEQRFAP